MAEQKISFKCTADEFATLMFAITGAKLLLMNDKKYNDDLLKQLGKSKRDYAYHKIETLYRKMLAGQSAQEWVETH